MPRTLVEVVINTDPRPEILLHGSAKLLARSAGVGGFIVSLAQCRTYATATVIAIEGNNNRANAQ
jgi:phosphopantetheinyl transferase (holo-ACP synthase)